MSAVWQSRAEGQKKTSLKIVLGESYIDYSRSLVSTALQELSIRREVFCLSLAKLSLKKPLTAGIFPQNPEISQDVSGELRNSESSGCGIFCIKIVLGYIFYVFKCKSCPVQLVFLNVRFLSLCNGVMLQGLFVFTSSSTQ